MEAELANPQAAVASGGLPPLAAADAIRLDRFIALGQSVEALAADQGAARLLDLYAWLSYPIITAWLDHIRAQQNYLRIQSALDVLRDVGLTSDNAAERCRAARSILFTLTERQQRSSLSAPHRGPEPSSPRTDRRPDRIESPLAAAASSLRPEPRAPGAFELVQALLARSAPAPEKPPDPPPPSAPNPPPIVPVRSAPPADPVTPVTTADPASPASPPKTPAPPPIRASPIGSAEPIPAPMGPMSPIGPIGTISAPADAPALTPNLASQLDAWASSPDPFSHKSLKAYRKALRRADQADRAAAARSPPHPQTRPG